MTPQQTIVFDYIKDNPGVSVFSIVNALNIPTASGRRVSQELRRAGLIEAKQAPASSIDRLVFFPTVRKQ